MDKKKKKNCNIVIVIVMVIILLNICGLINNLKSVSYDNYHTISEYVNENYKTLEKIANESLKGNKVKNPKHVYLISVHSNETKDDNAIVEFYTGGKGLAPSTNYYGFYYSENNNPSTFQNCDEKLVQYKTNSWEWIGTGDNKGKTIKIIDNWFYFEAKF